MSIIELTVIIVAALVGYFFVSGLFSSKPTDQSKKIMSSKEKDDES